MLQVPSLLAWLQWLLQSVVLPGPRQDGHELTNRIAGAEPGLPDEAGEGSLQDLCLQKGTHRDH